MPYLFHDLDLKDEFEKLYYIWEIAVLFVLFCTNRSVFFIFFFFIIFFFVVRFPFSLPDDPSNHIFFLPLYLVSNHRTDAHVALTHALFLTLTFGYNHAVLDAPLAYSTRTCVINPKQQQRNTNTKSKNDESDEHEQSTAGETKLYTL